jgi:acyl-coenzyme A thioesterase PaaI-like protein
VIDARVMPPPNEPVPVGWLTPLALPADLTPAVPAPGAPPPGTALAQHFADCYGCGEHEAGGLHLQFKVGEGVSVTARFVVTKAHQGSAGLAHGGVLTAALDETQATVMWLLQRPAVTARLEAEFLTPVPVGSIVHLEASCLGTAGRKIYTAASAWLIDDHDRGNPDGRGPTARLALRSCALFVAVPVEHFTAHADPGVVAASFGRSVPESSEGVQVNP